VEDVDLPAIVREGFAIAANKGDPICLTISGNADMEMVPLLGPFLQQFHEKIGELGVRLVLVDLRNLYFMNSSCIKALLTWIASVKKLTLGDLYRVQFLTNPKQHWQKRSLRAIQDFAPSIVVVDDA
jgi:hypothetical protein